MTFQRIDFDKFRSMYATTEKAVKRTDEMKKSQALARAQARDAAAKAARKAAAAKRAKEYNKARYAYLLPRYKAYIAWRQNTSGRAYDMKNILRFMDYVVELGYDKNKFDQKSDFIGDWLVSLDAYAKHRIAELS